MTDNNDSETPAGSDLNGDEIYLRIWEKQQDLTTSRWTIITFFMSVSFALFGLSLQDYNLSIQSTVQRIAGLAIYWFSYALYRRYSDWSHFLRSILEEMETTSSTRINLSTRWKRQELPKRLRRWTSINRLLVYFGLLYIITVMLLWQLGI